LIDYLSYKDIQILHDVALERFGGLGGEKEPGQIQFMAEKPAMEVFGHESYPGLFLKAAVYMHGFATRQFFNDGNKRTAYLCARTFLRLNGYRIRISDDELYDLAMDTANSRMTEKELAPRLEAVSGAYPRPRQVRRRLHP
jgi:death-on-curing protein